MFLNFLKREALYYVVFITQKPKVCLISEKTNCFRILIRVWFIYCLRIFFYRRIHIPWSLRLQSAISQELVIEFPSNKYIVSESVLIACFISSILYSIVLYFTTNNQISCVDDIYLFDLWFHWMHAPQKLRFKNERLTTNVCSLVQNFHIILWWIGVGW